MEEGKPIGPIERTAAAMWLILEHDQRGLPPVTTAEVAKACGIEWKSAFAMLEKIARRSPLRQEANKGWTFRCDEVPWW